MKVLDDLPVGRRTHGEVLAFALANMGKRVEVSRLELPGLTLWSKRRWLRRAAEVLGVPVLVDSKQAAPGTLNVTCLSVSGHI